MDDSELESLVRAEISDAETYIDSVISPKRALATRYYNGEPFGDEVDGRSTVVSRDVHDTVQSLLPSLMRIFFSPENVVEFTPRRDEQAAQAAQATDYVQYIITEENPGFITFWSWFKDALIRKTGIVKYWYDESVEVCTETYRGLDENGRYIVTQQPDASVVEEKPGEDGSYDITITRKTPRNRFRIECVPPEEFLISRKAKDVDSARFACHRTEKTRSDLTAMGYTEEQIDTCGGGSTLETNVERIARNPWDAQFGGLSADPANFLIPYYEAYVRVDYDGDGIAELRRICLMGDGHSIVANHPTDEIPFALLCPDPEPHVIFGNSTADDVMDVQRVKSQLQRISLDSLVQTVNPRTTVVEGQVNMDDVLNNEVGAVIRQRSVGMVGYLETPQVAQVVLPFLAMMDDVKESRTGTTKASQGLAADVLQSTTKSAVSATVQAAQERLELVARIFSETGVKRLVKGLLRLITTHQDKAKLVRLRGTFVPVDPREWDASMDVSVNVGLGGGTKEDKLTALGQIAMKQENIILQAGPQNPVVSLKQYAYTLRKMAELSGFRESSKFFSDVPDNYQPPQPAQPPDPQAHAALILAQAQAQGIQADIMKKHAELDQKHQEMLLTDARERYRIDAQTRTTLNEQSLKYGANVAQVNAQIMADADQHQQQLSADAQQAEAQRQHDAEIAAQDRQMQAQQAPQEAPQ